MINFMFDAYFHKSRNRAEVPHDYFRNEYFPLTLAGDNPPYRASRIFRKCHSRVGEIGKPVVRMTNFQPQKHGSYGGHLKKSLKKTYWQNKIKFLQLYWKLTNLHLHQPH